MLKCLDLKSSGQYIYSDCFRSVATTVKWLLYFDLFFFLSFVHSLLIINCSLFFFSFHPVSILLYYYGEECKNKWQWIRIFDKGSGTKCFTFILNCYFIPSQFDCSQFLFLAWLFAKFSREKKNIFCSYGRGGRFFWFCYTSI